MSGLVSTFFLFNRYPPVADEALRGPGNAQSARMIATAVFASDVNTTSSVRLANNSWT
jgi:hypothetical protein